MAHAEGRPVVALLAHGQGAGTTAAILNGDGRGVVRRGPRGRERADPASGIPDPALVASCGAPWASVELLAALAIGVLEGGG